MLFMKENGMVKIYIIKNSMVLFKLIYRIYIEENSAVIATYWCSYIDKFSNLDSCNPKWVQLTYENYRVEVFSYLHKSYTLFRQTIISYPAKIRLKNLNTMKTVLVYSNTVVCIALFLELFDFLWFILVRKTSLSSIKFFLLGQEKIL